MCGSQRKPQRGCSRVAVGKSRLLQEAFGDEFVHHPIEVPPHVARIGRAGFGGGVILQEP